MVFIWYLSPGIRSKPTITPVLPSYAAFMAVLPARTASSLSTVDWNAIDALPQIPGFSFLAFIPKRFITRLDRWELTSP